MAQSLGAKAFTALCALAVLGSTSSFATPALVGAKVLSDEADGTNWPSYGRTYSETHFSPLKQIDEKTVGRLNLAWTLDLDVSNSITVPIEMDGVIYLAAGYSIVHAVDAVTGKLLWRVDTGAARASGPKLRIGWGIRGLAIWKDKLYVGTEDGRLIAMDRATGKTAWSTQTFLYGGQYISGAPRVFGGKVVIGSGGADFSPVRGYVTAYDAESGKKVWRFFIVPGKPGVPDHEVSDPQMALAAKTWTGDWWKYGGGGTDWNAITYDPELDRVYLGTGNGGPWNWRVRSPGGGDNLYLASVMALDAKTGKYLWHYQETPGDAWDYGSSSDITLATIPIEGKPRKVLLHAPKNGFFYVIDRESGTLISGEKLGRVNWADRIDAKTGRPVETPGARYEDNSILLYPSLQGMHHWTVQAYSPITGLAYVPTLDQGSVFSGKGMSQDTFNPVLYSGAYTGLGARDPSIQVEEGKSILKARDPKTQKDVWTIEGKGVANGGVLATAGNLVFQGLPDGWLHAYSADKGADLWKFWAGVAVTGAPITYSVGGKQYLTITAGPLNGATAEYLSSARFGWDPKVHPRRLLTFVLDGTGKLPPTPPPRPPRPIPGSGFKVDTALAEQGAREYGRCTLCHGPGVVSGGTAPDLRASAIPLSPAAFAGVVHGGALQDRGMPVFAELSDQQMEALRHYIRSRAEQDLAKP